MHWILSLFLFGENRLMYTIKNQCIESPNIPYEDGARKIFLYTKGEKGNASKSLSDMLKYIEDTSVENVTNEDIHTIHEFVEKAKHRKEIGIQYMRLWEENERMKKIISEESRAKGLAEGLAEGRAEGRAEERKVSQRILVETYQKLHQTLDAAKVALIEEYSVSSEEAEEIVAEYWK